MGLDDNEWRRSKYDKDESYEKCVYCIAHEYDSQYGDMCTAPVCIKDYDYDIETRVYTPKDCGIYDCSMHKQKLIGSHYEKDLKIGIAIAINKFLEITMKDLKDLSFTLEIHPQTHMRMNIEFDNYKKLTLLQEIVQLLLPWQIIKDKRLNINQVRLEVSGFIYDILWLEKDESEY